MLLRDSEQHIIIIKNGYLGGYNDIIELLLKHIQNHQDYESTGWKDRMLRGLNQRNEGES